MPSKYNKELPKHGHKNFVFVVTGVYKLALEDGRGVLGVFTSLSDAEKAMRHWSCMMYEDVDWAAHDLRYPLVAKAGA
jgi:hypothetical protein